MIHASLDDELKPQSMFEQIDTPALIYSGVAYKQSIKRTLGLDQRRPAYVLDGTEPIVKYIRVRKSPNFSKFGPDGPLGPQLGGREGPGGGSPDPQKHFKDIGRARHDLAGWLAAAAATSAWRLTADRNEERGEGLPFAPRGPAVWARVRWKHGMSRRSMTMHYLITSFPVGRGF